MTERRVCCWRGAEDYSVKRCMTDATYTAVTLAVQEMLNKRQILIYQSTWDLHSDGVISFFVIARRERFSFDGFKPIYREPPPLKKAVQSVNGSPDSWGIFSRDGGHCMLPKIRRGSLRFKGRNNFKKSAKTTACF